MDVAVYRYTCGVMGGRRLIVQTSCTGVVVHVKSYCMPMRCPCACCFAGPLYLPLHQVESSMRVIEAAFAAVKAGTADAAQERVVEACLAGGEAGGEHGSLESVVPLLLMFSYGCLHSPTQLRLYLVGHRLVLCLER
jgi:hypothetical protein